MRASSYGKQGDSSLDNRPPSHFEIVARAFQVFDISHPLLVKSPEAEVEEVLFAMTLSKDPLADWFCLIRDEATIHGYVSQEDEVFYNPPWQGLIQDHVTLIAPNQIVASSMPLLDLIPLFRKHYFFFVLTRNEITHVVSFLDMDKLPVKLCLFSLVMALESGIIDCLTSPSNSNPVESYLGLLSDGRRAKAEGLCHQKYGQKVTPQQILLCTNFIDKKTILFRSPYLFQLLPFQDKHEAESFFGKVHDLRNQIAHSDSILTLFGDPVALDDFVNKLRSVTMSVSSMRSV
jgi:hypothetical protein